MTINILAAFFNKGIIFLIIFALSGCSMHYTDREGFDRHIGFISVKSRSNNCVITNTVESAGLTIDITKDSGGVNLGYRIVSKSYIQGQEKVELKENAKLHMEVTEYNRLAEGFYPSASTPPCI